MIETDFKETKLITPSFNEILTDLYNDNNEDEEDDDEEEEL